MREIKSEEVLPGLVEVQDYLYPKPIGRSKKYIIAPSKGFLWVGRVVCASWGGPSTNYEMLRSVFEQHVHKTLTLKLSFKAIRKYKLLDFYIGAHQLQDIEEYETATITIQDKHKFFVHFPDGYGVEESMLMRTGTMGVLCLEETLERFRKDKLGYAEL